MPCFSLHLSLTHDELKAPLFLPPFGDLSHPILVSYFITVSLHLLHGLSRLGSSLLLDGLQMLIVATCVCLSSLGIQLGSAVNGILSHCTSDLRTVLKSFALDPKSVEYACCSKCFACYAPDPSAKDSPYPDMCSFRATLGSEPCGALLLHGSSVVGRNTGTPLCRYIYQPMSSWIARFLSRPGVEQSLIKEPRPGPGGGSPDIQKDVWDAEALSNFNGWDGLPFFKPPENEARLAFGLSVDWFNPYGGKIASCKASIGAIYMICMNLPPHLRYRIENVYLVGIIPGPVEPKISQINHLFRPLVDDLIQLWFHGVYLSRTALHKSGRLVRCALIPIVCDLPALRKTAGFSGHSSACFCSFCLLQKADIANFDYTTWPRRSWDQHLREAKLWRDAPSEAEQNKCFESYGVRWSELLRLPYWDITKYSTLDSMHNLFLGQLKRHCMEIWQTSAKDKKMHSSHTPDQQHSYLNRLKDAVLNRSEGQMKGIRLGYILAFAKENRITVPPNSNKIALIGAIIKWVSRFIGIVRESPSELFHSGPQIRTAGYCFRKCMTSL